MKRRAVVLTGMTWSLAGTLGLSRPARSGERVRIGFAQDTLANDWRAAQVRQFLEALAHRPELEVLVTNAGGSTAQQIMDIEDLVAKGIRILVTSPRDGTALAPVIAAAHGKGIPVVLLTRRASTQSYTTFIAPDDYGIGARACQFLARLSGGRARVLMLTGLPNASTTLARSEGFLSCIAAHPHMQVVESRTANFLRTDALQATESVIASGITFDAVYAQSDSMASGARMALESAGLSLPIIGIDYIAEARDAIRAGRQKATFTYPTCAREGAAAVTDLLAGRPVPREITVPSIMVTKDNIDDIQPIF